MKHHTAAFTQVKTHHDQVSLLQRWTHPSPAVPVLPAHPQQHSSKPTQTPLCSFGSPFLRISLWLQHSPLRFTPLWSYPPSALPPPNGSFPSCNNQCHAHYFTNTRPGAAGVRLPKQARLAALPSPGIAMCSPRTASANSPSDGCMCGGAGRLGGDARGKALISSLPLQPRGALPT